MKRSVRLTKGICGRKIDAIKAIRQATHSDLKWAKDVADNLWNGGEWDLWIEQTDFHAFAHLGLKVEILDVSLFCYQVALTREELDLVLNVLSGPEEFKTLREKFLAASLG